MLYASETPMASDIQDFFTLSSIPQLQLEHQISFDYPITISEIEVAIYNLKMNKSPGLGGFTAELYKKGKGKLLPRLSHLFVACVTLGNIPPS